jgi:hypothetical protein
MANFVRSRFLKKLLKRLRRFASILLFGLYLTIGVTALWGVENPFLTGGLHIATGIAHLFD